ncbi:amino acid/amide ABC transporter substrate-binding protein (HAAT family) [Antricoccus suffuscus]|uniref:Amino acid/amide ABC transporter substrate-binding protein (HAAT family) n=1 Tax=Antricoccus suffuscus TaxID=1629062 RepID=A0A2T1A5T1_9ACTN|nr:ABC transporter substrate-binding protein [Antricoccus suffuscus]PRZ43946.1 amino acid/amide ABC transporter substrate-binding protein (HAAT family) [Antricoccus suffuscus]
MHKVNRAIVIGALTLTLAAAACSTKGGDSGTAKTGAGGVKTDYGVTDSNITLGVMTDQSGVDKTDGIAVTQGNQLWADQLNANGGVCGRKIKLNVRDTGYDAQKAVTLYGPMKDDVAGMVQLLGSPIVAALKSSLTSDSMLSLPVSWAAGNLAVPVTMNVGATYSIEILNGLAYLQGQGLIKDGDAIGHIYIASEYGDDALAGSKAYAKDHDMTIVGAKISAQDTDMTAAVTSLKSQNVKAVVITTASGQTGGVATQMAAQGLGSLPLLGNNPTFAPTILQTPAKDAMANYYRSAPIAPFNSDIPIAQKIAAAYDAKFQEPPMDKVDIGYVFGMAFETVLQKACKNKDMTRAGLVKASHEVKVDTKGLTAPLDYSTEGEPPTRATYIEKVDPSAKGGLMVVDGPTASTEAKKYEVQSK